MLSCEHGGMTTRFGTRGRPAGRQQGYHPAVVGMRACSYAVVREHGGANSIVGTRHWRRAAVEGAIPAKAGVRACPHAVVRTRRRDSTVGTALPEDDSRGGHPGEGWRAGMPPCRRASTVSSEGTAVRGPSRRQLACGHAPMPPCEHSGATAHSALGGTAVGQPLATAWGRGGTLCAGPKRDSRHSSELLKGARFFGSKTDFFRCDSGKGSAHIGPVQRETRRGKLDP
jgi:hypothetical protein